MTIADAGSPSRVLPRRRRNMGAPATRHAPAAVATRETEPLVGVLGTDAMDVAAMTAWFEARGYATRPVTVDELRRPDAVLPALIVTRCVNAVDPRLAIALFHIRFALISDLPLRGLPRTVTLVAASSAPRRLEQLATEVVGAPARPEPVPMTDRERAVITTYVLGATVADTAAEHFIAEATVRTHYRRVARRYNDAGRSAANKSQLLLCMVADGWISLDA